MKRLFICLPVLLSVVATAHASDKRRYRDRSPRCAIWCAVRCAR